jgi:hypothetical protein
LTFDRAADRAHQGLQGGQIRKNHSPPANVHARAGVLRDTPRSNPDEKFQRTMEDKPDASLAVARQRRLADAGRLCSKLANRR